MPRDGVTSPGTRLLVGTKRGLFVVTSDAARDAWTVSPPLLAGREVYHAFIDGRDGTAWAATDHAVWGAHVHRSTDGGTTWETLGAAPHYADERGLKAIWQLAPGPAASPSTLYAGIEPAGLFVSHDSGESWEAVSSLNDHPTNTTWQPAGGGLALGSIQHDPRDANRIYCSLSAGGVYRSDDRGDSWVEITDGLPSEFGYALAIDPADPDVAYVIPEESSHMRATIDGRLRVYRTRDAGASWRALTNGLPQEHAYVSILREGMCNDALDPVGLYFGTSSGHLFASRDGGASWRLIAGYLPRILSVTATAS